MSRHRPAAGDVIQVTLQTGRYAYGRVLQDASVAFYRTTTAEPGLPPIGSRDYQFIVGVYDDVAGSDGAPVVGHDPSQEPEDDWPPPHSVRDPISGTMSIYHHGHIRPATQEEAEELEPAAVWDLHHLIDRLNR
jgi:immunity protein 26 of polymorphic toxin system